jgi:aminoglycoside/choline kinase family phosphotransferase
MGPITYDIVSLVEDPYAALDAPLKARLRERFAAALRDEGLWPGDSALDEEYDLMTAQRLLKAVGTFTNQASVRGKRDYVPYIAPAAAAAREALERLGRFPALCSVLGPLVESGTAS